MIECMRNVAHKSQDELTGMSAETKRIKVSCLDVIVTTTGKAPYYEIKYKEIGEDVYHVGYGSYKLDNVLAWRDECFELVGDTRTNADWIRSMTDEELALAVMCPADITGGDTKCDQYHNCRKCTLDWLQRESEE